MATRCAIGLLTQPTHGQLLGVAPDLFYAPADDYFGSDHLTFAVSDGISESLAATISITVGSVNDEPAALEQTLRTDQNNAVNITLAGEDVDGDVLSYRVVTQPLSGTLAGIAPNLVYTPLCRLQWQ